MRHYRYLTPANKQYPLKFARSDDMLKLVFFDWGAGALDVEAALGIGEDVVDFLRAHISGLELEATDNAADMEDNQMYWFSCPDEPRAEKQIAALLAARLDSNNLLGFSISTSEENTP